MVVDWHRLPTTIDDKIKLRIVRPKTHFKSSGQVANFLIKYSLHSLALPSMRKAWPRDLKGVKQTLTDLVYFMLPHFYFTATVTSTSYLFWLA